MENFKNIRNETDKFYIHFKRYLSIYKISNILYQKKFPLTHILFKKKLLIFKIRLNHQLTCLFFIKQNISLRGK